MEERIAQLEAVVSTLIGQLAMKADKTEVDRIHKRLDTGDLSTSVTFNKEKFIESLKASLAADFSKVEQ